MVLVTNFFEEFIINALDVVKSFDKDSPTEAEKVLKSSLDIEFTIE